MDDGIELLLLLLPPPPSPTIKCVKVNGMFKSDI